MERLKHKTLSYFPPGFRSLIGLFLALLYAVPALWNVIPTLFCKWCSAVGFYAWPWINMLDNLANVDVVNQSVAINFTIAGLVFFNVVLLYLIGCLYSSVLKKYKTNAPKSFGLIALATYILLIIFVYLSEVGCGSFLCSLGSHLLTFPSSVVWVELDFSRVFLKVVSYVTNSFIVYGVGYGVGVLVSTLSKNNRTW